MGKLNEYVNHPKRSVTRKSKVRTKFRTFVCHCWEPSFTQKVRINNDFSFEAQSRKQIYELMNADTDSDGVHQRVRRALVRVFNSVGKFPGGIIQPEENHPTKGISRSKIDVFHAFTYARITLMRLIILRHVRVIGRHRFLYDIEVVRVPGFPGLREQIEISRWMTSGLPTTRMLRKFR